MKPTEFLWRSQYPVNLKLGKRSSPKAVVYFHVSCPPHTEFLDSLLNNGRIEFLLRQDIRFVLLITRSAYLSQIIFFSVNEGLAISTARPQYSGIANALVTIGRKEGLRGLYQGVTPNVWGAGASWGLYFFL